MKHKSKSEQSSVPKIDEVQEDKSSATEAVEAVETTELPEVNNAIDSTEIPTTKSETPPATKSNIISDSNTFLRPSPSETSLTRSRSLQFPPKPKHSPDCKDNPYKL